MQLRRLLCLTSAVLVLTACSAAQAGVGLILEQYNTSGAGGNYTNASSIPVNTNGDLLLGLSALSTNYVGNNEAAGGTTAPFTDGLTATDGNSDLNQNTQPGNALFDLGAGPQPWYVEYQLPSAGAPNGETLTGVTVISGHQDNRVNQQYDILVSKDGVNFTSLSNGSIHSLGGLGSGFAYNPSGGNGGAATSTVSNGGTTVYNGAGLAYGIKYIEFVDNSGGNDIYRELAAYGQPTPEPGSLIVWGLAITAGGLAFARRRKA